MPIQEFKVAKHTFDKNEDMTYIFSIARFFAVIYNPDGTVHIRMTGASGDKTTIKLNDEAKVTSLNVKEV